MLKAILAGVGVLALASCSELPSYPTPASRATPATPAAHDAIGTPIAGRYIVRFRTANPDWRLGIQSVAGLNGPVVIQREFATAITGAVIQMSDAAAAAMRAQPDVASVEPDLIISANYSQINPPSWGLDRIDQRARPLNQSFAYGFDGTGVTVYIIDSGIEFGQADFGGRARAGIDMLVANGSAGDCNGHGTHVAGTVGGGAYGVAKRARLVSVRVLDCAGRGYLSDAIAGVDWVMANATLPAVANMSLGTSFSSALNQAVENSIAAGISYVVAAGNAAVDACTTSPASAPSVISVGATDISDAFAWFSNFGSCVRINAPGVNITSLWLGSGTNALSGTSMAAPHVAGAAALYLQAFPQASPAQVRSALTTNATANAITGVSAPTPNLLLYTGFLNVQAVASFSSSCAYLACSFDGSTSTAFPGATYSWNFGDGTTGSGVTSSHTFSANGTFVVTLTVTDPNGPGSTTRTVTVVGNRAPVTTIAAPAAGATFTRASNGTVPVSFAGAATDPEDGVLTGAALVWTSSRDGQIGTGTAFSKNDLSVGSHTITLTAKDGQNATGVATATITIAPPPVPVASFVVSCTFLVCTVDASGSTAIAGAAYGWSFGDATTGTGVTASHSFATGGTYPVTLTVTDANGTGTPFVKTVTVVPNSAPSAAIASPVGNPTFTRASNGTVAVSFSGSGADVEDGSLSGSALVWTSSRDGQIGTGASFSRSDLSVGAHTITLTARDAQGLTGSATTSITIAPPLPLAAFSFTCTFLACTFDASASTAVAGAAYAWNFGDATSGTGSPSSHVFAASGTFQVTLTVTDANGSGALVRSVAVVANNAPVAAMSLPASNATFTRASNGTVAVAFAGTGNDVEDGPLTGGSLLWTSSRDGQIGTGASFTKNDLSVGTHTITLTARDAQGIAGSVTRTITIAAALPPVASFTTSCAFLVCTFNATGSTAAAGATYAWRFGDDQTGSGPTITHSYIAGGTFQTRVTVSDANGSNTLIKMLMVVANRAPTAAISSPANNSSFTRATNGTVAVSFAGSASDPEDGALSGASLVWSSNRDGQIGTGASFTKGDLSVGSHTITLTARDAQGASAVATTSVTIAPPPLPVGSFTVSCTFLVCALDASASVVVGGATYAWSFGDATTGTGITTSHPFAAGGTYAVTLTVADANGTGAPLVKSVTVVANRSPTAVIVSPSSNATFIRASNGGVAVSFAGNGSDPEDGALTGAALVWTSNRDGQIGTGGSFTRSDLSVGTHAITLTVRDAQGATGSTSTSVTIAPPPVPVAYFSASCTFLVCALDASSSVALSGATYAWNFGDATGGTGVMAVHTFPAGGTFRVTVIVSDANGSSAPLAQDITVVPNAAPAAQIALPASNAIFTRATNGTVSVSFAGTGTDPEDGVLSGASLVWTSSRDGQIGTGTSLSRADLAVGAHAITLTARDAQGATGTATTTITIAPPPLPLASFSISCTFLACSLDASGSVALVGATFAWSFGDGTTGAGSTTTHTFAAGGTFPVTLTVTDANGSSVPVVRSVAVVANRPPTALITLPYSNASFTRPSNSTVAVAIAGTGVDPEDGALSGGSLIWTSSRDGQIGTGSSFTKNDLSVGVHTITLTAVDSQGATAVASITITVVSGPPLPVAVFTFSCAPAISALSHICSLDATGSASNGSFPAFPFFWDFGDGRTLTTATARTAHPWPATGTYVVTLRVTNAAGLTSAVSQAVTVP